MEGGVIKRAIDSSDLREFWIAKVLMRLHHASSQDYHGSVF
jgi:hypothetical protein